jgi:hypothetical protein
VPAAAVKPALRVVGMIIWLKVCVAGQLKSLVKCQVLSLARAGDTERLGTGIGAGYVMGRGEIR